MFTGCVVLALIPLLPQNEGEETAPKAPRPEGERFGVRAKGCLSLHPEIHPHNLKRFNRLPAEQFVEVRVDDVNRVVPWTLALVAKRTPFR
jgi:hypothetical protein